MKKTILLLSCFLSINIAANSDAAQDDILKAIKKSTPELLKIYLSQAQLSESQIKDYIYLAKKISKLRKEKSYFPKKPNNVGMRYQAKAILSSTLAIAFSCGALKTFVKEDVGFGVITIAALVDYFAYKKASEWWQKGKKLNEESMKNSRTYKQKYLDSLQVKQMLKAKKRLFCAF